MIDDIKSLPLVRSHFRGKVRDVFDLGDTLLIVTSDRISAFDVVFTEAIPGKGKVLNSISAFFFKYTSALCKNHFITDNVSEMPPELAPFAEYLHGRAMLVKKTRVVPFECICRGYISGSAWEEYKTSGTVSGKIIDGKLLQSQRFAETLFTPSTKASSGHDINISFSTMCERVDRALAEKIRDTSIALFDFAHTFYYQKNIILADTKFEFGTIGSELYLIDEIFTPDSSRLWLKDQYEIGTSPKSYDKQYIRDYLLSIKWDKTPPPPPLPDEIIQKTVEKYNNLLQIVRDDGNHPTT